MNAFRKYALKDTDLEKAQPDTLRNKVFKIGARVMISARRVYISFSSAYPYKELFAQAFNVLASSRLAVT